MRNRTRNREAWWRWFLLSGLLYNVFALGFISPGSPILTVSSVVSALTLYVALPRSARGLDAALRELVEHRRTWLEAKASWEWRFPDRPWGAGPAHQRVSTLLRALTLDNERIQEDKDDLTRFWRAVMEETVMAGLQGGDRETTLKNVRRLAAAYQETTR